jgi:hypothetical protein
VSQRKCLFYVCGVKPICKNQWVFFSNQLPKFEALNYDSISVLRNTHICSVSVLQNKTILLKLLSKAEPTIVPGRE